MRKLHTKTRIIHLLNYLPMTTIKVLKLELTNEELDTAKFTLSVLREANFTDIPSVTPFEVENIVEWECRLCFLDEFAKDEYLPTTPQYGFDDDAMQYPTWVDAFGNRHETKTIEEFIDNCDTKEFAAQFIEKFKLMALGGTQYDFLRGMKNVNRPKRIAA